MIIITIELFTVGEGLTHIGGKQGGFPRGGTPWPVGLSRSLWSRGDRKEFPVTLCWSLRYKHRASAMEMHRIVSFACYVRQPGPPSPSISDRVASTAETYLLPLVQSEVQDQGTSRVGFCEVPLLGLQMVPSFCNLIWSLTCPCAQRELWCLFLFFFSF